MFALQSGGGNSVRSTVAPHWPFWLGAAKCTIALCCSLVLASAVTGRGHESQAGSSTPAKPGQSTPETKKAQAPNITKTGGTKPAIPAAQVPPLAGAPEDVVTITGSGFGTTPGKITFNGVDAGSPSSWSDTSIKVRVPKGLPAGNVTLNITTSTGSTKSIPFTVLASPPVRYSEIPGDFRPFFDDKGNPLPVRVSVLTQDLRVIGQDTQVSFTRNKMHLFYTQADPKEIPAWVLVGTAIPGDHLFPFTPTRAPGSDSTVVPYQELIMGDFCLADAPLPGGNCTTGLVTVDQHGNSVVPQVPPAKEIKAYVQTADGTFKDATLNAIGPNSADISFTAPQQFKPAWLVLEGKSGAHKFAYTPAPPVQISDLVYTSDDLKIICNIVGKNLACDKTVASDLLLKPIASDTTATFVALQENEREHLLVAHIRAPMGLEPTAILVTNTTNNPHTSVIVRRTLKPGGNTNILNVDMTVMDQTTVARNFGQRIAKRYLAVSLEVKNPTVKKLQFNKSALYFDVDYIEAKEKWGATDFFYEVEDALFLGLNNPSPYTRSDFVKARNPRLFRFGLEQNVKHSPINYLSILGSYDETTEKTGQDFDTIQLLASIMNTIATGGIAGTGQFRSATSLLSGVFLPGLKGIVLNDSRINRRRANLVAQTLQEVIAVPPSSPVTTIVLLPRNGILAFYDAQIPVMIQSVKDVHIVPEVVTEVTETPVQKDQCKVGYTKDQTREALGEPTGVITNADGTSVFTYPTGPVASASFEAGGHLISCQQRSNSDQLAQAKTLPEIHQTLTRLGLTFKSIALTDGSVVLADISGVQQTFHFDAKGNKATDYTFLFSQIKTYATGKRDALEAFLQAQGTALSPTRAAEIKNFISEKKNVKVAAGQVLQLQYPSPDIQNGKVVVTFKDAENIAGITFEGDKPEGVQ
jgi:hypothetical protein